MTHYVLLRLAPDSDKDAAERRVRKTYQELDETLSFLHNPRVYRSCVERDSNADIMAGKAAGLPDASAARPDGPGS